MPIIAESQFPRSKNSISIPFDTGVRGGALSFGHKRGLRTGTKTRPGISLSWALARNRGSLDIPGKWRPVNLEPAMLIRLGGIADFQESSHGENLHLQNFPQGPKMPFSANLRKSGRPAGG